MADITVTPDGRFFFVQANGVTLGHAYKLVGVEGESALRSLLRQIFRPLWRASANAADGYVHLEELHGGVFSSRDEAIQAILDYHDVEGLPRRLPRGTPPATPPSN